MDTNPYAPPKAAVADIANPGLQRRSVFVMIVLTVVTFGLYYIVWFFRRRAALNALNSSRKLPLWPLVTFAVFTAVDYVLAFGDAAGLIGTPVMVAIFVGRIAVGILMLVQCFTVKGMIEDHLYTPDLTGMPALTPRVELSGVLTFFFSIFYLQYIINREIAARR